MSVKLSPLSCYALIHNAYLNYYTLYYANLVLCNHLLDDKLEDCLIHNNKFKIKAFQNDSIEMFELNAVTFLEKVQHYATARELTLEEAVKHPNKGIIISNSQFIRSRAIIIIYEAIEKLIDRRENIYKWLHSLDWFQVLKIIRNIVSHLNPELEVKWFDDKKLGVKYPDTIKWKSIEIKKGQKQCNVRYNDGELFDLINFISEFILENQATLI